MSVSSHSTRRGVQLLAISTFPASTESTVVLIRKVSVLAISNFVAGGEPDTSLQDQVL